jgi:hypothetical protein
MKLAGQLTQQRYKAGIGAPAPESPSLISRIFDVIQRPLYASANTVDYAVEGKNPLEGTWRGISGQDKTSYDKVLQDMGMSGGWQRSLLGFGLDIGLDPTTYLGAGIEKNVAEGIARKAAVEGSGEAIAEHLAPDVLKQTTQNILKDSTQSVETEASKAAREAHMAGTDLSKTNDLAGASQQMQSVIDTMPKPIYENVPTIPGKQAVAQAKEVKLGDAMDAILQKKDEVLAQQRGKVYLKYMGKQTPIASEGLYNIGTKAGELARKVGPIEALNKAFRPNALYPQGTNDIIRNTTAHGIHLGDEQLLALKRYIGPDVVNIDGRVWGGLAQGERENVMRAISRGEIPQGVAEATGRPLADYANQLKGLTNRTWGTSSDLGLVKEANKKENFVPMILKGGSEKDQKIFMRGYKSGKEGFTLADAEAKGLNPVIDPLDAYGQHIIKSIRQQTPARVNQAVEREFGIHLDELAPGKVAGARGKDLAQKLDLTPVSLPGFQSPQVYFPPEVADGLKAINKRVTNPEAAKELLQYFDKVQQAWKLNMTAVNPGHHIRNFAGDVFLNFEDGVKNPARYTDAAKVLNTWRDAPENFTMKIGDQTLNAGQLMDLFTRNGGKSGFFRQEFAQTSKSIAGLHPIERIRQLAEKREDWTRMAHFLDVLEKNGGTKDLEQVAQDAGKRVRKFNIDYGDLTPFEQKFMKRVAPFYTWMRKNIPVQLETLAMDPGKISTIPKGLRALQGIVGNDPSQSNVLGFNIVPEWLRQMAGVRIAGEGLGRNQVYWNPSVLPFMDIGQYFSGNPQDIGRQLLGGTTPLLRIPIEQATGRMLSSGAPVGDTTNYYGGNILPPSAGALKSLVTGKVEPTDIGKLLGLSLYNVGPQQQLGELRRQQDPVQAILRAKKQRPRSWEPGYGKPAA